MIVCGVEIGCYVFVGVGVVVQKDVLDFVLMVGVLVWCIGWMSCYGECLVFDVNGEVVCLVIGECYCFSGEKVELF